MKIKQIFWTSCTHSHSFLVRLNFCISTELTLILSDNKVHPRTTVLYVVLSWQWCGVGEQHTQTTSWPQCLLPRGSTSRWLQTTVLLDLDHYDQHAETWTRYGSQGYFRSVMESFGRVSLVRGEPKIDCTHINQCDMGLSFLYNKRFEALTLSAQI